MDAPISPDEMLTALKQKLRSARAHRHLENVHEMCRQIHTGNAGGSHQFSIVNVARRLSAAHKGPALNTLRSVEGSHFRQLIRQWAASCTTNKTEGSAEHTSSTDGYRDLLLQIPKVSVRSEVAFLLAQGARARTQLDELKGISNIVIDLRSSAEKAKELQLVPPSVRLLESERDAVRQVFDKSRLRRFGIHATDDGGLVVAGGGVLFSAGFTTGIQKLLDAEGAK